MPMATCKHPIPPRARAVSLSCGGRGRDCALAAVRRRAARVEVPRILWLNCTVVGFSVILRNVGEKARISSGIHRSANLGKLLYTRPASSPATKAPETSVMKARAFDPMTSLRKAAILGVTFEYEESKGLAP